MRYAYDERGRLVERAAGTVSRVLAFDAVGRIVSGADDLFRFDWSYADSADGLVVTRTISGRAELGRFQIDPSGRVLGAALTGKDATARSLVPPSRFTRSDAGAGAFLPSV